MVIFHSHVKLRPSLADPARHGCGGPARGPGGRARRAAGAGAAEGSAAAPGGVERGEAAKRGLGATGSGSKL